MGAVEIDETEATVEGTVVDKEQTGGVVSTMKRWSLKMQELTTVVTR